MDHRQDVTEYVQHLGYIGQTPVLVDDGYVVSPFRQFYPDFCHQLRCAKLEQEIKIGSPVTFDSIHRGRPVGYVESIHGKNVTVRWIDTNGTSLEWLPDLKLADVAIAA